MFTNDVERNAAIAARILSHRAQGKTMREAFDAVLGQGAYQQLADELYDTLNAKPEDVAP